MSAWSEHKDSEGRWYYYNNKSQESQWTKPVELMTDAEKALTEQPWQEYTQNGRKYWYNSKNGQSVWDMPEVYKEAMNQCKEGKSISPKREITSKPKNVPADNEGVTKTTNEYVMFEEAEAAFWRLLDAQEVSPNSSWRQAMAVTISEPDYWALRDPKERKDSFNRYVVEKRRNLIQNAKDRETKLRQGMKEAIKRNREVVKPYMSWSSAKRYLMDESLVKFAIDEAETESVYSELMEDIRRTVSEKAESAKKDAKTSLAKLLISLDLEVHTKWADIIDLVKRTPRFANDPHLSTLHKLDILMTFQDHIQALEGDFEAANQLFKKGVFRQERQRRDAFNNLLIALRSEGMINDTSVWSNVFSHFKDDCAYLELLGCGGSTPLDLFWDMVEEARVDFRRKSNYVLDILEEKKYEVLPDTEFSDFLKLMDGDNRLSAVDQATLRRLFRQVQDKTIQRAERERHSLERRQRRRIDALRSVIRHLDPAVGLESSWSDVRPRVSDTDEFNALDNDSQRKLAFDKHLRRLLDRMEDDRESRNGAVKHNRREAERIYSPFDIQDRRSPRGNFNLGRINTNKEQGRTTEKSVPQIGRRRPRSERDAGSDEETYSNDTGAKRPMHTKRTMSVDNTSQQDRKMDSVSEDGEINE